MVKQLIKTTACVSAGMATGAIFGAVTLPASLALAIASPVYCIVVGALSGLTVSVRSK